MPSYDQLNTEAAWRDEHGAPALSALRRGLLARWPAAEVGIRGDNHHLRGYHRSRRWIRDSSFCSDRGYSVSRTAGDRGGGDANWACAIDLGGIAQGELYAVCRRLDAAVRAGHLEKITEWYGNFGGDDRVDGFDNITDRMASADSSHLTHLHISFDRGRANEDHSDLLAILTGDDMPDWFKQADWDNLRWRNYSTDVEGSDVAKGGPAAGQAMWLPRFLKAMDAKISLIASKVDLDPAELAELKAATEAGAKAGVSAGAAPLAAAIADALSDDLGLTPAQAEEAAERALRKVFGGLDTPPQP